MKSTYGKLLRSRHRVGWAALVGAPELVHVRDLALSAVLLDLHSAIDDALVLLQDVTEVKRQGPPKHAAGKKRRLRDNK